jgi:hypothetical protein
MPAVRAHQRHHDGRDIVPAPAAGCPAGDAAKTAAVARQAASAAPAPGGSSPPPADAAPATATVAASAAAPASAIEAVRSATTIGSAMIGEVAPERAGVLGARATVAGDRDDTGAAGAAGEIAPAVELEEGSLPFTGGQVILLALIGAGLALTGLALLRAHRVRETA